MLHKPSGWSKTDKRHHLITSLAHELDGVNMAKRTISRQDLEKRFQGGGGGPVAMPTKRVEQAPAAEESVIDRIERLDATYSQRRSEKLTKKNDLSVIDDARLTPSERLRRFVEVAKNQGHNPKDALEFGLKRLEQKGLEIADASLKQTQDQIDWERLIK